MTTTRSTRAAERPAVPQPTGDLRADWIIAYARERGNEPRDLRDAAHEAHHAIECGLGSKRGAKAWNREVIHRALMRRGRGASVGSEVMARAVEQIVCRDLGVDPGGDVRHWAFWSCMEAIKGGIAIPSIDWFVEAVERAVASKQGRRAADAVLALVSK